MSRTDNGRTDKYGDLGPKSDRRSLATTARITGRPRIGSLTAISRTDGTEAVYRETVPGPRLVSDTRTPRRGDPRRGDKR